MDNSRLQRTISAVLEILENIEFNEGGRKPEMLRKINFNHDKKIYIFSINNIQNFILRNEFDFRAYYTIQPARCGSVYALYILVFNTLQSFRLSGVP